MKTSKLTSSVVAFATAALIAAPLAAQDMVEAIPAPFDASSIGNASRSYTLSLQGTEAGVVDISTAVDDGIITLELNVDVFTPQGSVTQHATVVFTDELVMRSSHFTGDFGMFQTETTATYEDGHVTGQGQSPGPAGITTVEIDTTLADGVIDSGIVPALLLTLDWHAGAAYTFDAFDANSGTVRTYTVLVTGSEEVTVPAGTFNTWVVETREANNPMNYRIDQESATIVKMIPAAQPIVMELRP